jgi:hypothetical protein
MGGSVDEWVPKQQLLRSLQAASAQGIEPQTWWPCSLLHKQQMHLEGVLGTCIWQAHANPLGTPTRYQTH